MQNPETEISTAINLCAGAPDADIQISAFHKYMDSDHSFLHPLCYVPPGPDSLKRVVGIFMFYRGIIWKTKFTVKTCAFDKRTNNLYVDLTQEPCFRGISWAPAVPMHCHFKLRWHEDVALYKIIYHEDIVQVRCCRPNARDPTDACLQPREILMALPVVRVFGWAYYLLCEYMGLLFAYVFILLGWWVPEKHIEVWKVQFPDATPQDKQVNGKGEVWW